MKKRLKDIQHELVKISRIWASGQGFNASKAAELRREAAFLNHAYYFKNIPVYRDLAGDEGCGEDEDIETIKKKLMLSADIFKSYQQEWLDIGDFGRMSRWLSGIYHKRIDADTSGAKSIDGWIERLGTIGVNVVYSSGTSGAFSFVPRDEEEWKFSRLANYACLATLLTNRTAGKLSANPFLESAARFIPPDTLAKLVRKNGLPDFDAAFLGFRQGRMGNQALIEELAPLFRHRYFLYDMEVDGTALRCLRRGARTDDEQRLLEELRNKITGQSEATYLRLIDNIDKSINKGKKVFIFGAPYQFDELVKILSVHNRKLCLKEGSIGVIGGGWKSFTGEAVSHDTLLGPLAEALNLAPGMILEGYSMTEISLLMVRCEHGRFHIPPIIEPVIFDEELNPVEGRDIWGAFGFLDPLAASHSGFITSNDFVHMIDGDCACGLPGPFLAEIGRLPGSEVKGCGGIMGSVPA